MIMAEAVQVFGAAHVILDTGSANALENLGYTDEGVFVREMPRSEDIPGDQNGGAAGIPIDIQYFGAEHMVNFTLTKFDLAVLKKVLARLNTTAAKAAPGTQVAAGTLMSTAPFRLLIKSDLYDASTNPLACRNYVVALPLGEIANNYSVKYRRAQMQWRCLPNASLVTWNTTVA
jgi:hypothetical protein